MTPLNALGLAILIPSMIAILIVPRKWASVPLLLVTCYMVLSQGIQIGGLNFFAIRLVILAGLARVVLRGERISHGLNGMDWLMLLWAASALFSCAFHADPVAALIYNSGLVFNACGVYFLLRVFCRSFDEVMLLCRIVVVLLIPVALEMVYEKIAASNAFSMLGGVPIAPNIREGNIRAQGPFAHAILAGTVGAVFLPIAIGLWHRYRRSALIGIVACLTMVIASRSSGPAASAITAVVAILMWRIRYHMKAVRWAGVACYLVLTATMKVPPYYLLARMDLSGGSTGYHRARLIESSIDHLGEWWFAGTDFTRHWMVTGVSWSPNHTDITNHYLMMGVLGGLPLMVLFIMILICGFSIVGKAIRKDAPPLRDNHFFVWSLGASLFAHAATCISVSYFDQSFVFLYITIAAIASLQSYLGLRQKRILRSHRRFAKTSSVPTIAVR